jgi:hypothetical protein
MSDDATSTPAAVQRLEHGNGTSSTRATAASDADNALARRRKRFATQIKRKAEFIHDIMFNLDLLIYAELCALYYME